MCTLFSIGQVLKGRIGHYVISKQLQETPVIVKSALNHPRVSNERDVLERFTGQSRYIRLLVDEIVEPAEEVTIVLRHLNSTVLRASISKTLTRTELKYVSRQIPGALRVVHGRVENRSSDVQLADFGGTLPVDHQHAREGAAVGAAIWRSPESLLGMLWGVERDIWSFGTLLISLIYGGDFNIFDPPGEFHVLRRQFQFFGPPPPKYAQLFVEQMMVERMLAIRENLREDVKPFRMITEREMCEADKRFIGWFMKIDLRDWSAAEEIMDHEWWGE
ncbi:kinase-like domain-containing protein [Staphylotrichum tortipilum]|uniref:Kinase-like domain-containing protein n=1 Tax=Staphylotrichum tortipilum TaxID=2831512 RepID=A0AAN6MHA5_9PEZI|nr:kinase-like domain-containing protein [Staphylotrichum longicolle]